MSQNIQNYENSNNLPSDRMTNYLQNQRPSVIMGNDNEPIIIPPLNTDIRFNAFNSKQPQFPITTPYGRKNSKESTTKRNS